ncbi:MAG TPA: FAD-binding oxidoreductase [Candidatus Limnocylindria bacterium]|nr:FAD-binding oxidoreductase [Candidatus Limnocylindria bacterium]
MNGRPALLTDGDLALRPTADGMSPWLREALADEGEPMPAPPLGGSSGADIAIVGGGYTGLWAALHLAERDPSLQVVVLEARACGWGPSGRNGGFVNGWWDELATLRELFGDTAALTCARELAGSVHAIGAWAEREGADVDYRRAGMLTVSTTPLHDGAWAASLRAAQELGVPEAFRELSAAEIALRCRSPRFRGGALMEDGATVHPGRLARALRRACLVRGIVVHEGTSVRRLVRREGSVRLRTHSTAGSGELRAGRAILAINAWAAGWPGLRGRILPWSSWMVRTEPIPELVRDRLGWTGGESIVDARFSVHYLHVTSDGRIAFGAGGGRPGYDGRIGRSFSDDLAAGRRAVAGFRHLFPDLAGVRMTDMWGGPIDVSGNHLPQIGTLPGGRVHFAAGYSGNGVAPSHLAGRILAALALDADEPITRLPIVGARARLFPPEPLRYVGARILREAMIRREDGEEAGQRPPWWLRELTRLPRRLGYHLGPW